MEFCDDFLSTSLLRKCLPSLTLDCIPFSSVWSRLHPSHGCSAKQLSLRSQKLYIQNAIIRCSLTAAQCILKSFSAGTPARTPRGELKMLSRNLIGWGRGRTIPCPSMCSASLSQHHRRLASPYDSLLPGFTYTSDNFAIEACHVLSPCQRVDTAQTGKRRPTGDGLRNRKRQLLV